MAPFHDTVHLELFADGSGCIAYEWVDHPYADPNKIEFKCIDELITLISP